MDRCRICGRTPADVFAFRRHAGMVVMFKMSSVKAPLCRDHAIEVGRRFLRSTLALGWWGVISFFANFVAIGVDLRSLRKARRLAPPVPATDATPSGLAGTPAAGPVPAGFPPPPPYPAPAGAPAQVPAARPAARVGSSRNAFGFEGPSGS